MPTYNFKTQSNGVSVFVDSKYQKSFFDVVTVEYDRGNFIVMDSNGIKTYYLATGTFQKDSVTVTGTLSEILESVSLIF